MKKVLIVEDDAAWADILASHAARLGADWQVVVSAGQAIEAIDDWRPDLILLDMLLAGETGAALLNELRTHGDLAKIPVVVCSSVGLGDELRQFGVKSVLDKAKVLPSDIRAAINGVLYAR